jgi:hypothetical protein
MTKNFRFKGLSPKNTRVIGPFCCAQPVRPGTKEKSYNPAETGIAITCLLEA